MDNSCFNCAYFPSCVHLKGTKNDGESDSDRMAFLDLYGKNCPHHLKSG